MAILLDVVTGAHGIGFSVAVSCDRCGRVQDPSAGCFIVYGGSLADAPAQEGARHAYNVGRFACGRACRNAMLLDLSQRGQHACYGHCHPERLLSGLTGSVWGFDPYELGPGDDPDNL